jgi:hypothetical protein
MTFWSQLGNLHRKQLDLFALMFSTAFSAVSFCWWFEVIRNFTMDSVLVVESMQFSRRLSPAPGLLILNASIYMNEDHQKLCLGIS